MKEKPMMKGTKFWLSILGMVALVMAWMESTYPAPETMTVTDLVGRQISVSKDPARIIGLGPGALRLILYLDVKNKVVGVEDIEKQNPTTRPYWIAHSNLDRLPSVGPGGPSAINKEPDLEKVLALKPDLIFITYMDRDKAEVLERKIGIPVVVLNFGPFASFDEKFYESLRLGGKILHRQERAEHLIRYIENVRKDLYKRTGKVIEARKPLVYVGGIGFRGTQGIESTETGYAPFEWVKAKAAVKAEGATGHIFVDREKLLRWDPEIVFIDSGGMERIREVYEKKPAFYQGLQAFRNKKVYTLHAFNWYSTNIETVLIDAYAVGKILYPREFQDVRLEKKADEVYTFFLGRPIFKEMETYHGKLLGKPPFLP